MNIYLTGYRGSGKSETGRRLGSLLSMAWVDTDIVIQQEQGKTIREIFEASGEEGFRTLEAKMVERLARDHQLVVSLGGGALLNQQSRVLIGNSGKCVWLSATPQTLCRRIVDDNNQDLRPPLTSAESLQEIRDVLKRREHLYAGCADYKVDTENRTIDEVVELIVRWWRTADK